MNRNPCSKSCVIVPAYICLKPELRFNKRNHNFIIFNAHIDFISSINRVGSKEIPYERFIAENVKDLGKEF